MKLNGKEVLKIGSNELTNKVTSFCSVFGGETARQVISSGTIVIPDSTAELSWQLVGGKDQFGISDVQIVSPKKNITQSKPQTPNITANATKTPAPAPTPVTTPNITA